MIIYRLPIILENIWQKECEEYLNINNKKSQDIKQFNLIAPSSHCPACKHPIRIYHNIPIIGFLWLKGKCVKCKQSIPFRYPMIELMTAIIFLYLGIIFGASFSWLMACIFSSGLITLSFIDFDHHILPDQITMPLLWLGLISNTFYLFTSPQNAIIGATFGYLVLWVFAKCYELLTGKFAMGHGDFKLLACSGAWLGWQQLPFILLASSLMGSLVGLTLILLKKTKNDTPLPFGPYLALAIMIALCFGREIFTFYFQLSDYPYI